jgi:hypothetical protein
MVADETVLLMGESITIMYQKLFEELDNPAVGALGVRSRKLNNALNGQ